MNLTPKQLEARRKSQRKYYEKHKPEMIARAKKWNEENREKARESRRKSNIRLYILRRHRDVKKRYGLTPTLHEEMLIKQNFKCALSHCPKPVDIFSPIDHDHETGEPRGILCTGHNLALGIFENLNPECLLDAFGYLRKSD